MSHWFVPKHLYHRGEDRSMFFPYPERYSIRSSCCALDPWEGVIHLCWGELWEGRVVPNGDWRGSDVIVIKTKFTEVVIQSFDELLVQICSTFIPSVRQLVYFPPLRSWSKFPWRQSTSILSDNLSDLVLQLIDIMSQSIPSCFFLQKRTVRFSSCDLVYPVMITSGHSCVPRDKRHLTDS